MGLYCSAADERGFGKVQWNQPEREDSVKQSREPVKFWALPRPHAFARGGVVDQELRRDLIDAGEVHRFRRIAARVFDIEKSIAADGLVFRCSHLA